DVHDRADVHARRVDPEIAVVDAATIDDAVAARPELGVDIRSDEAMVIAGMENRRELRDRRGGDEGGEDERENGKERSSHPTRRHGVSCTTPRIRMVASGGVHC